MRLMGTSTDDQAFLDQKSLSRELVQNSGHPAPPSPGPRNSSPPLAFQLFEKSMENALTVGGIIDSFHRSLRVSWYLELLTLVAYMERLHGYRTVSGCSWWLRQERIHLQCGRPRFDPWVGKIPWRRKWKPTPRFLPGEFRGQRSLGGGSQAMGLQSWPRLSD